MLIRSAPNAKRWLTWKSLAIFLILEHLLLLTMWYFCFNNQAYEPGHNVTNSLRRRLKPGTIEKGRDDIRRKYVGQIQRIKKSIEGLVKQVQLYKNKKKEREKELDKCKKELDEYKFCVEEYHDKYELDKIRVQVEKRLKKEGKPKDKFDEEYNKEKHKWFIRKTKAQVKKVIHSFDSSLAQFNASMNDKLTKFNEKDILKWLRKTLADKLGSKPTDKIMGDHRFKIASFAKGQIASLMDEIISLGRDKIKPLLLRIFDKIDIMLENLATSKGEHWIKDILMEPEMKKAVLQNKIEKTNQKVARGDMSKWKGRGIKTVARIAKGSGCNPLTWIPRLRSHIEGKYKNGLETKFKRIQQLVQEVKKQLETDIEEVANEFINPLLSNVRSQIRVTAKPRQK